MTGKYAFSILLTLSGCKLFLENVHADTTSLELIQYPMCTIKASLQDSCLRLRTKVSNSLILCANECLADYVCLGITTKGNDSDHCEIQQLTCPLDDDLSLECSDIYTHEGDTFYFNQALILYICANDGSWDSVSRSCHCVGPWTGLRCDIKPPESCFEIYASNSSLEGWVWADIQPPTSNKPIHTLCSYTPGLQNYHTFIFSNDGHGDFNKSWTDYVSGFSENEIDHWLGLDNILAYNRAGYTTVRFSVVILDQNQQEDRYVNVYKDFYIGSPEELYKFNFSNMEIEFTGSLFNLGDCLGPSKNKKFSTWDHGVDTAAETCASQSGIGWWFSSCPAECNPMGKISVNTVDSATDSPTTTTPVLPSVDHVLVPGADLGKSDYADRFSRVLMYFTSPVP